MKFDPDKLHMLRTRLDEAQTQAARFRDSSDEWEISSVTSVEAQNIEAELSGNRRGKKKLPRSRSPRTARLRRQYSQRVKQRDVSLLFIGIWNRSSREELDWMKTLSYIDSETLGMPDEEGHLFLTEKQWKLTNHPVDTFRLMEDLEAKKQELAATSIVLDHPFELGSH